MIQSGGGEMLAARRAASIDNAWILAAILGSVRSGQPYRCIVTSVFRCSDYIEAQLLTGLLREHGLSVFLQGALLQGALGELPALGHLSIMVDDSDRAAAELILAAYERGDLKIEEEDGDSTAS